MHEIDLFTVEFMKMLPDFMYFKTCWIPYRDMLLDSRNCTASVFAELGLGVIARFV